MLFLIVLAWIIFAVTSVRFLVTLFLDFKQGMLNPMSKELLKVRGRWQIFQPFHWSHCVPMIVSFAYIIHYYFG